MRKGKYLEFIGRSAEFIEFLDFISNFLLLSKLHTYVCISYRRVATRLNPKLAREALVAQKQQGQLSKKEVLAYTF